MAVGINWSNLGQRFVAAERQPKLAKYRSRKWEKSDVFAGWIEEANLPKLEMEQALALYAASGGTHRREFSNNPIEEIRDSLDFLLYDTVKLEGRFQECSDDHGGFKLEAAGKEFISYLLCLAEPRLFAVWNNNAEKALGKLGTDLATLRSGPLGIGYIDLLEGAEMVRQRLGTADFRSVDEFFYWLTRPADRGDN